jgi:endonuclease/exonuclease/phosphatase (EEP) superfamily protein YafD
MRLFLSSIMFAAGLVVWLVVCKAEPARSLRVMTYNLNFANPDRQASLDAIAKADPDVVLLQEVTADWRRALDKLADQYPHRAYRANTFASGSAVLSKLPIKTEELLAPPSDGWFAPQRIVVTAPFGSLQILNVHLRPANDRGSWVRGYFTTRSIRLREIATYWTHLVKDVPTIVAGDFNEAPDGKAVSFLADHGFSRIATDGPPTWHYEVLTFDLDHVLVDDKLTGRDGHVLDAGISDHRPVIVTVAPR